MPACMLTLSPPSDHDRLNAAVFEIVGLNVHGTVCIPGNQWDCYNTLGYLEQRLRQPIIATECVDGSEFFICDKHIRFASDGVFITLDPYNYLLFERVPHGMVD
jgi:hypothetical protein